MIQITVPRIETEIINNNPGWTLLYGRRKVGKTFMIHNFIKHEVYFAVRIDRSIFCRGFIVNELSDLRVFRDNVVELLNSGKTVVIDEFQRLPRGIIEDISRTHPNGKLILCGSSMRISSEIMGKNSPLLGLLRPVKLGLLDPSNLLTTIAPEIGVENAIRYGPILRDPWTIPFYSKVGFLENITSMIPYIVNGLIGEIFREDQRELTQIYSSILNLMGQGYMDHREIANILYSRDLVSSSASSSVLPFMKNMFSMGLLEKNKLYNKKTEMFKIASFSIYLFQHLHSKYGISDRVVQYKEIKQAVENQLDLALENFIADLFAKWQNGRKELLKTGDKDIDILITARNKPKLVAEVKWGKIKSGTIDNFLKKVEEFNCKKLLITKEPIKSNRVEIVTPTDILKIAKKTSSF